MTRFLYGCECKGHHYWEKYTHHRFTSTQGSYEYQIRMQFIMQQYTCRMLYKCT